MRLFGIVFPCSQLTLAIPALAMLTFAARAEPPAPAQTPAPAKIRQVFEIDREGNKIGATTIDIERQNDTTIVKVATDISVKVMFIEAYRYEHASTETWKGGRLVAYKSQTNDNGTQHAVRLTSGPAPDKLTLEVDGKRSDVPKGIAPANLWSKDVITRSDLFEPANGKRLSIKVKDLGEETVVLNGVTHQAHHYQIADKTPGEFDRDLWFEGDLLVQMKLLGADHSTIISALR